VHPDWTRIDEGYIHGWISPDDRNNVISFVDGEDPATIDYNDSERFSAPQDNAGTDNPSIWDQFDAVWTEINYFQWQQAQYVAINGASNLLTDLKSLFSPSSSSTSTSANAGAATQVVATNAGAPAVEKTSAGSSDNGQSGTSPDPRLQPPGSGVGEILHRTYVVQFNTTKSPGAIIKDMAGNINSYTANRSIPYYESPFTPTQTRTGSDPLFIGNVLNIDGPALINPQVMVTGRTDTSFTFTTMTGHPEAGVITFSAQSIGSGRVAFVIDSTFQASNSTYYSLYNYGGGQYIQTQIWNGTLENVVKNSGGSNSTILNRTVVVKSAGGGPGT
jgi:hypothetical protein